MTIVSHWIKIYCLSKNVKSYRNVMPITNKILVTLEGSTLKLCKSKLKLYFMLLDWRFLYKCNINTVFCCDYNVTLNEKCIAEIKESDSIEIVLSCNLRLSQTRFWSHFKIVSQNCVNQNLNCILYCETEGLLQKQYNHGILLLYCHAHYTHHKQDLGHTLS